jgi:hypothetical protein
LQESVDRLTEAFDRYADRLSTLGPQSSASSNEELVLRHVRRYLPFYALGALFALLLVLLPITSDDRPAESADRVSAAGDVGGDQGAVTGLPDADVAVEGASAARSSAQASGASGAAAGVAPVGAGPQASSGFDKDFFVKWDLQGTTIGGFACDANVRQMPWSSYAIPCHPRWTGTSSGATYQGVTSKEITIVIRRFPESANSQAVEAAQVAAGFASTDVARATSETWMKYFNKVYELWGRKVKWVVYESRYGNSTDEAQSKGKEGACADADYVDKSLKAFAIVSASNVFAECAAERGMITFAGGAYFPERWYDKLHPYVWHLTMDCERISEQVAEYIGKRLANKPAKWAKQTEQNRKRKFATYVPDNDEYQYCTDLTEKRLKDEYNVEPGSRYNYILDVSRFPDEAAKAAVQFKADLTTTLVMACDPISMIFLTQAAKAQQWWPEWFNIGVAANDTDNYPRTWDADEIRGSLFGMSQLGRTVDLLGPKAEPAVTYRKATGTQIPEGTTGNPTYFTMMHVMNALQAAGPLLTPATVAQAIVRLPAAGGPKFAIGKVSFRDGSDGTPGATDHTAIDDSREIWWNADGTGFDGEKGTYVETYGGKRFGNGQWPREDPPVFR